MASTKLNKAKVNITKLEHTADIAKKTLNSYKGSLESVKNRTRGIKNSWEGPCAEIFKLVIAKDLDIINSAFEEVSGYPTTLMVYHSKYSGVISSVKDKIDEINSIDLK